MSGMSPASNVDHQTDSGVSFAIRCLGIALAGAAATLVPWVCAVLLFLAVACYLIGRSVNWATAFVLFVVYSNAAVVAVKFHGVPGIAAHAIVGLLAIPITWFLYIQRRPFVTGPAFPWLVGIGVVQCAGAIFSREPLTAWQYYFTFLQEGVLLYLLVTNAVRCPQGLRYATWGLLAAGVLMGAVPMWQQLTGDFENQFGGFGQTGGEPGFETGELTATGEVVQQRLAGSIGEKNRYAQVMLMLVPLALFRWRDEASWLFKGGAILALGCATAGALLAFSRSTILAMGFVAAFAAWKGFVSRRSVAFAFGVGVVAMLIMPQYRTRLASLVNLKELLSSGKHSSADGALKGRATEMGAAVLVFVDHPFLGVGPGMFRKYSREYGERIGLRALAPERQAHCLVLDVAAENGLPGVLCLLAIFVVCCRGLLSIVNHEHVPRVMQGFAASYVLMIVMYFATGIFLHFAFIRYFWVMIALGDATILIANAELNAKKLT